MSDRQYLAWCLEEMKVRNWLNKVVVDRFWKTWHNKFRLNSKKYVTPQNPLVQRELDRFGWSKTDSDKEKARKAWVHVYETTDYKLSSRWYTPEETLKNGRGDCEDVTFLIASMLTAMGVKRHSIRTGVLVKPDGLSGEHVWNEVDGMVVDATGRPEDVPPMEYHSNQEFVIVEN